MFSVIIPNFNSASTIRDTLNSVRDAARWFDPSLVEIILVDNGSTDTSLPIIRSWHKVNTDIILRLFSETTPNSPGLARNIGLKNSVFPWVLFLDADDNFQVDIFKELKSNIGDETSVIIFNYEIINPKSHQKRNRILHTYSRNKSELLRQYVTLDTDNSIIAILLSKELLLKNKILFDEGYYEDIYFLFQVILRSEYINFLDKKLYLKNNSGESITNTFSIFHIYCYTKAWKSVHNLLLDNYTGKIISNYIDKSIRGLIGQVVMNIDLANCAESDKEQMRLHLSSCIREFYPLVDKSLITTENTYLDQQAINFIKCYNRTHDK